jgi:hypothetical protein
MDFVAGNMGLNNKYHVSANASLRLYAKDFDGNGKMDAISSYYIKTIRANMSYSPLWI